MSSHHVVREAQEPALFIWETQELTIDFLEQLLEWSPTLLVREESLDAVLAMEIKIDVVVCTPDQAAEISKKLGAQSHVQLVLAPSATEVLPAALAHLKQQGQQAINLLANQSSAESYLLEVLATQQALPNAVVLTGLQKWSLYRGGRFTKWLPAKEKVYVQGVLKGASLRSEGFARDLQETTADEPQLLETTDSGTKHIFSDGSFWVAEQLS